jgi:acetylglutamate kinase
VFRGAAMTKPALAQAFCKDIELLRSCGLQPIVVHGNAPQNLVRLLELEGAKAIGLSAGVLSTRAGALTVDGGGVEALLGQNYVPVIAPIARGEDGGAHPVEPDTAAAALACALGVPKLILLADSQGILEHDELVTDLTTADLHRAQDTGGIATEAIRAALAGGVGRVHVIDGRTPHSLIAELFTDRGVGTLVTP